MGSGSLAKSQMRFSQVFFFFSYIYILEYIKLNLYAMYTENFIE